MHHEETDLLVFVRAVRAEAKKTNLPVELNDDPKRLLLGYKVGSTSWSLRFSILKRGIEGCSERLLRETVRDKMRTPEGRMEITTREFHELDDPILN